MSDVTPLEISAPEAGQIQEINSEVSWIRMPLPFDLDHINLYLVKDGDGVAIIDTGIGTNTTKELWSTVLSQVDKPVTKVIVTHMHPDHIGNAGHLVDKFRVPLYMTFSEYFMSRALVAGPNGADNWQDINYLIECGMPAEYVERARENKNGLGRVVSPIPLQYRRMQHGDELVIGNHSWQVMIGRGHSPEHACLYCKDLNVLLSGDQVLPQITPNIGAYSTEPEANSLALYLQSLPQFLDLPEDAVVLPSHKQPFVGLHIRVNELQHHHETHLSNLVEFCQSPKTLYACLPVLFQRELNPHNMFFAVAECRAHLNYLHQVGTLERSTNANGQFEWTQA